MRGKRILSLLLMLCLAAGLLAGCTIQFPDDLADDAGIGASPSAAVTEPTTGVSETGGETTAASDASGTEAAGTAGSTSGTGTAAARTTLPSKATTATVAASTTKDKYDTNPVPSSKPAPVEPEDAQVDEKKTYTCTLSIVCHTILDNWDLLKANKKGQVPADGVIYKERTVVFYEGETVFDLLNRETKKKRIHMEFSFFPLYNSNYIEGIHNLYEFDCGEGSGWMYKVNGWFPNYGCSRYPLKQGDKVEWLYTCDLGHDLGTSFDGAAP